MRITHILALTVLASAPFAISPAMAGEALHLTPPLFREQAREIRQVHRAQDLTTTPQPVAATKPVVATRTVQIVADVETTASH